MRALGRGRVPPTLRLVMQAPPAPRVAGGGPESLQQVVVEQRRRYDEGSGASKPLQGRLRSCACSQELPALSKINIRLLAFGPSRAKEKHFRFGGQSLFGRQPLLVFVLTP